MLILREELKIKKQILIAIFFAFLIFITPFSVVSQENKTINIIKHQTELDDLISQIQVLIGKIIKNYGQNQMIKALCNIIIGALDTIILFLFCLFFGITVAIPLAILMLILFFTGITNSYIGQAIFFAMFSIFFIWDYNCNFITFPDPFLLNSSNNPVIEFLVKDNNLNPLEICPCINE